MLRRDHAVFVGKHVGMTPDHLLRDRLDHVAEGEYALFLGHAGVEHDLQQEVAEFVAEIAEIIARDRVGDLIGLLDGVGRDARKILLEVPRAAGAGGAQLRHDVEQGLDIAGRGHGYGLTGAKPVCRKMSRHPSKTSPIEGHFHHLAQTARGAIPSVMSDQFPSETALVLFSGGQDSATCLAWALERFARVETLGFDYGQRHAIELECRGDLLAGMKTLRPEWAAKLGEGHTLAIPTLSEISDTALTRDVAIAMGADGLPNTFVPGRNLVFLTFAAALAYRRGITHIVGGMCETDYSGYPDCRDETIQALQSALSLGMARSFELHTPLMWLDKAATWKLADELGGAGLVNLICEQSHTCYLGERGARHDWGYGCGECPACALRAKGWREYATGRVAS